MLDYRSILTFLMGLLISGLSLVIFLKSRRRAIHIIYGIFVLLVAIWSFSLGFYYLSSDLETALIWAKFVYFFGSLIPTFFLLFSFGFPDETTRFPWGKTIVLLIPNLLLLYLYFWTDLMIEKIQFFTFENDRIFVLGPFYWAFEIQFLSYFAWTYNIIARKWFSTKGRLHAQLSYILIGTLIGTILALSTNVVMPDFLNNSRFVWLGPELTIIWVVAIAYAIVAHRLFDIRIIIRRTVVYSGLLIFALATYSIVVFIFAQLFGPDGQVFTSRSFVTNLIAALAIAVGFEPLRKWLTQTTDKFLFKGEYDPQTVIQQLAQSLSSVLDLDEALDTMMQLTVKNMRLAHAATVVIRPHLLLSAESKATAPEYDVHRIKQVGYKNPSLMTLDGNDIVIKYFTQLRQLVVAEELSQAISTYQGQSIETQILDRLNKFKIAVAIPLVVKDRVIGIVMFGEKLSGDPFLEQDLKLLQIISTNTAGAIEKARLYEEDQLKSEFVSIASHELLTPTAAIEGYLSMILDEKLVKVDEKARDYLTRVYQSARRLSQLVKDLLSVSRIEAGRIVIDRQPTQLERVVDQVVNDLLFLAKGRGVTILWNKPKKPLPLAFIDQEKLIQVLINLVSNGIKYNRAKGTIQITTTAMNKSIAIEVSDTGMGMTKEEISHLFEKFYRTQSATNAAIQGTGLGLYISKKLIELMGGEITVTSVVGQGSKFTVIVPQTKEANKRLITGDPNLMSPDQKEIYGR